MLTHTHTHWGRMMTRRDVSKFLQSIPPSLHLSLCVFKTNSWISFIEAVPSWQLSLAWHLPVSLWIFSVNPKVYTEKTGWRLPVDHGLQGWTPLQQHRHSHSCEAWSSLAMSEGCGGGSSPIMPSLLLWVWAPRCADTDGRCGWERTISLSFISVKKQPSHEMKPCMPDCPGEGCSPGRPAQPAAVALNPGWIQSGVENPGRCTGACGAMTHKWFALSPLMGRDDLWVLCLPLWSLTESESWLYQPPASCIMGEWWQPSAW